MAQKLMTKALEKRIPKIYSQENKGMDAIAYVHYFNPYGRGDWYVTEYDGKDLFFGMVGLNYIELGYFTLSELEDIRINIFGYNMKIERDIYFTPKKLSEVREILIRKGYSDI